MAKKWVFGQCHCGEVKFKAFSDFAHALRCNCSICHMKGYLHIIVSKENFEILTPMENLSNYQFGTKTAHHLFCTKCGITPFYIPRSHPKGFSINARCLPAHELTNLSIEDFDGQNWEASIPKTR